jgi:hypothetical protein
MTVAARFLSIAAILVAIASAVFTGIQAVAKGCCLMTLQNGGRARVSIRQR